MKCFNYKLNLPWAIDATYITLATTGLQPSKHQIFAIGLLHGQQQNTCDVTLYLAEQLMDEKEILFCFLKEMKDKPRILGYNGKQFLASWLSQRTAVYGIQQSFAIESLLDSIRHLKPWTALSNAKLREVASMAGYHRQSTTLPSDLPGLFKEYSHHHDEEYLSAIKQHLEDDLESLAYAHQWLLQTRESFAVHEGERYFLPHGVKLQANQLLIEGEAHPGKNAYISFNVITYQEDHGHFQLALTLEQGFYSQSQNCHYLVHPHWPNRSGYPVPAGIFLLALDGKLLPDQLALLFRQLIPLIMSKRSMS